MSGRCLRPLVAPLLWKMHGCVKTCGFGWDEEPGPAPDGRETLVVVARIVPLSPVEEQVANPNRHRFLPGPTNRTRRTLPLPIRQGAADLSPDPSPHGRIIGGSDEKSSFRARGSLD